MFKTFQMLFPDRQSLVYGLAVLVLGSLLMVRSCTVPPTPAPALVSEAVTNPVVVKETKVDTPIVSPRKTVKTYAASAKGLITLPKTVIADPAKHITDSAVVLSSEKRQVVTQVLDVGTGETTSYVSAAPDPWLAVENRGSLTLGYGFKRDSSEPVGRLNLQQDVLQTKRLHLGGGATLFTDGDYWVGVTGGIRW